MFGNKWVYKLNLDYSLLKIVTKCSSILSEETNKTHFTGKPYLTEIFSVYFKTLIDLLYIKANKIVPEPRKRLIVLQMQFCESVIAYDINWNYEGILTEKSYLPHIDDPSPSSLSDLSFNLNSYRILHK